MAWWSDMLPNLARREIAQFVKRFARQRFGIVTSYDPNTHSVKVNFMPDETLSGWIPIKCHGASSNGMSHVTGPSIGDQAIVHHAEEDSEVGHVSGWIHSEGDPPPLVPSGTHVRKHNPSGNMVTHNGKGLRYDVPGGAHSVVADASSQHRVQTGGWVIAVTGGREKFIRTDSATGLSYIIKEDAWEIAGITPTDPTTPT